MPDAHLGCSPRQLAPAPSQSPGPSPSQAASANTTAHASATGCSAAPHAPTPAPGMPSDKWGDRQPTAPGPFHVCTPWSSLGRRLIPSVDGKLSAGAVCGFAAGCPRPSAPYLPVTLFRLLAEQLRILPWARRAASCRPAQAFQLMCRWSLPLKCSTLQQVQLTHLRLSQHGKLAIRHACLARTLTPSTSSNGSTCAGTGSQAATATPTAAAKASNLSHGGPRPPTPPRTPQTPCSSCSSLSALRSAGLACMSM